MLCKGVACLTAESVILLLFALNQHYNSREERKLDSFLFILGLLLYILYLIFRYFCFDSALRYKSKIKQTFLQLSLAMLLYSISLYAFNITNNKAVAILLYPYVYKLIVSLIGKPDFTYCTDSPSSDIESMCKV